VGRQFRLAADHQHDACYLLLLFSCSGWGDILAGGGRLLLLHAICWRAAAVSLVSLAQLVGEIFEKKQSKKLLEVVVLEEAARSEIARSTTTSKQKLHT
jgi:heme exporter protein D